VQDRTLVDSLRAAGGSPRYTEYPDVNHGAWDKAYGDQALWTWLFAQRLARTSR
jgi:acetyl esterase/lipase